MAEFLQYSTPEGPVSACAYSVKPVALVKNARTKERSPLLISDERTVTGTSSRNTRENLITRPSVQHYYSKNYFPLQQPPTPSRAGVPFFLRCWRPPQRPRSSSLRWFFSSKTVQSRPITPPCRDYVVVRVLYQGMDARRPTKQERWDHDE